jgi:hypothetical protein
MAAAHQLEENNSLKEEIWVKASTKGTAEYKAIEVLLKGIEIKLPNNETFLDAGKHKRDAIRVKWWETGAKTYRDYALVHKEAIQTISENSLSGNKIVPEYLETEKPVFFGHYWFSDEPKILKSNVACLDYSAGKKDKLVAYQWNDGDSELSKDGFIWVDS